MPPSIHGTIRHQDDPKDKIAEDISKLTVAPLKIAPSAKQNSTNISNFDGEYHKWTKLEDNKRINVISSEIKERLVTAQLLQKGQYLITACRLLVITKPIYLFIKLTCRIILTLRTIL